MGGALHLQPLGKMQQETVANGRADETAYAYAEGYAEQVWKLATQKEAARIICKVLAPTPQLSITRKDVVVIVQGPEQAVLAALMAAVPLPLSLRHRRSTADSYRSGGGRGRSSSGGRSGGSGRSGGGRGGSGSGGRSSGSGRSSGRGGRGSSGRGRSGGRGSGRSSGRSRGGRGALFAVLRRCRSLISQHKASVPLVGTGLEASDGIAEVLLHLLFHKKDAMQMVGHDLQGDGSDFRVMGSNGKPLFLHPLS